MNLLVERVASDDGFGQPPLNLRPTMAFGDTALAVALDLLTESISP